MQIGNLTLIGTSHIAEQSLKEVQEKIVNLKPDIICIELDKKRYYALTKKEKRKITFSDVRRIGLKGFLFSVIGAYVEKKLGRIVGVEPGAEMMLAIKLAKKQKAMLALIDQDIEITLKKISQRFTWKEKWRILIDVVKGVLFKKKAMEELGFKEIDLTKVPSKKLIKKLIDKVKNRYPNLYDVLIAERNIIMAKNLMHLTKQHPDKKIIAIIGAGHEEGMTKLIKENL